MYGENLYTYASSNSKNNQNKNIPVGCELYVLHNKLVWTSPEEEGFAPSQLQKTSARTTSSSAAMHFPNYHLLTENINPIHWENIYWLSLSTVLPNYKRPQEVFLTEVKWQKNSFLHKKAQFNELNGIYSSTKTVTLW